MTGHMMLFKAAMARQGRKIDMARDWPSASTVRQRAHCEPADPVQATQTGDAARRHGPGPSASNTQEKRR